MNIAVQEGDTHARDKSFVDYVKFLDTKGFVTPHGKKWVDYVRKRANEANHEIRLMSDDDAQALLRFVQKLLEDIYEFPKLVPQEPTQQQSNP